MSSHHIVREKQEPALLVLGLDNFPDELLGQLLEWSPTLIATANTAESLVSKGIKIDWVITEGTVDALQPNVKLMPAGDGKLSDAALRYLTENEFTSVNIVTDELNLGDYEHFANRIDLVIFHENQKIYPVQSGFSKWKPAGDVIKILGQVNNLETSGLKKTGDNAYKTAVDGFFSLRFDAPILFCAEEL